MKASGRMGYHTLQLPKAFTVLANVPFTLVGRARLAAPIVDQGDRPTYHGTVPGLATNCRELDPPLPCWCSPHRPFQPTPYALSPEHPSGLHESYRCPSNRSLLFASASRSSRWSPSGAPCHASTTRRSQRQAPVNSRGCARTTRCGSRRDRRRKHGVRSATGRRRDQDA